MMDEAMLVLRLVVGLVLAMHGARKLSAALGGGIGQTTSYMASLGFRLPVVAAVVAGATEVGAGFLLATGVLTFLGVAGAVGVLTTAILTECLHQGFWAKSGGYEFPLTLLAATVAIGLSGPGALSLDVAVAPVAWQGLSGVPAIGAGLILSGFTLVVGRSAADRTRVEAANTT